MPGVDHPETNVSSVIDIDPPPTLPHSSPAVMAAVPVGQVLNPDYGEISPELVSWLEKQMASLRRLLARTTQDLVTIGHMLGEVKNELAPQEFPIFVDVLGISRATAYRWISVSQLVAGRSHAENVEATALYALAAKSTPEEVRQHYLQRADAGHKVTHQEVQATLRQHRPVKLHPHPNLVERIVDGMVEAEEAGAGRDWRGRDARTKAIQREIARFAEESRADVAATVAAWGHACIEAAASYLEDGGEE